ncbi:16241_t:CDS:1, partial [Funneliformis geosporum]
DGYFDFAHLIKISGKQSFIIGWNLGNNQPIIGKLRHSDDISTTIQHFIPSPNQQQKTLLKECKGSFDS